MNFDMVIVIFYSIFNFYDFFWVIMLGDVWLSMKMEEVFSNEFVGFVYWNDHHIFVVVGLSCYDNLIVFESCIIYRFINLLFMSEFDK